MRNTNPDKWKERFFRKLPPEYKLLWIYMFDDCNNAGIWNVDFEAANKRLGYDNVLNYDKAKDLFKEEIIELENNEKWFIKTFIETTCKTLTLNPDNNFHKSILNVLIKYNLHEDYLYGKTLPY